jgi:hypothetical protein
MFFHFFNFVFFSTDLLFFFHSKNISYCLKKKKNLRKNNSKSLEKKKSRTEQTQITQLEHVQVVYDHRNFYSKVSVNLSPKLYVLKNAFLNVFLDMSTFARTPCDIRIIFRLLFIFLLFFFFFRNNQNSRTG